MRIDGETIEEKEYLVAGGTLKIEMVKRGVAYYAVRSMSPVDGKDYEDKTIKLGYRFSDCKERFDELCKKYEEKGKEYTGMDVLEI